MALQYDRKCQLKIGGMTFDERYRIRFHLDTHQNQDPNKGEFILTNVSPDTKDRLFAAGLGARVEFSAGYKENIGPIMNGTVVQMRHGRENPTDTYFTINISEGEIPYNHAAVNADVPKNSTAQQHVDKILEPMLKYGLSKGFMPSTLQQMKIPRAGAYWGLSRDFMRDFAKTADATWFIQNDQIHMLPLSEALPGVVDINSHTGMISLPVQTLEAIFVKALINPELTVGKSIHLNKDDIQQALISNNALDPFGERTKWKMPYLPPDGIYKIYRCTWEGDTRGGPWYVTMTTLAKNYDDKGGAYIQLERDLATGLAEGPAPVSPTAGIGD